LAFPALLPLAEDREEAKDRDSERQPAKQNIETRHSASRSAEIREIRNLLSQDSALRSS